MKNLLTIVLAVLFIIFLGCSDENPNPTSADQDAIDLAKKGKGPKPPKNGDPKTCTDCDAQKNIICTSSKTLSNGATVTWTSSFGGFDYEQGKHYTVTVTWSVVNGTATFTGFKGKKKTWTPKDVSGTGGTSNLKPGSIDLTVNMDPMHRAIDPGWEGYIGNGHFKLELNVTNTNGSVRAKLGVNVHLEDPDVGSSPRCP